MRPIRMPFVSRILAVAIIAVSAAVLAPATTATAQPYTFATFTWDQSNTPDVGATIPAGTPAGGFGAIISNTPNAATGASAFPLSPSGFNDALSLGRLVLGAAAGARAVNLPRGDVGTTVRSGFELSWSAGRQLQNQGGADLVVYESGSNGTTPEALMVQVRRASDSVWLKWRYQSASNFQLFVGAAAEGGFATPFDLTDFGLATGEAIDRLRIVNMTSRDRMETATTGFVIPEDNGATSTILPAPGPLASFGAYGASTLDPDPLYVGILQTVAAPPTATTTPAESNTPTQTPTVSVTATPSETATATETPTSSPTESPTESPTASPTHSPTLTPSATPTATNTPTATDSATPTSTPTATPSGTPTETPTASATPTDTPSPSPTGSPTSSPSPSTTRSPTITPTPLASIAGCPPLPEAGCVAPLKGSLRLNDSPNNARDSLRFHWRAGVGSATLADYGDPRGGTTDYRICIYDEESPGVPLLKFGALVPAGGTCPRRGDCWAWLGTRITYRNSDATPNGISALVLRATPAGARIAVRGRGINLALPVAQGPLLLVQRSAVTVQVQRSDTSNCWEARFTAPQGRNSATRFRDSF